MSYREITLYYGLSSLVWGPILAVALAQFTWDKPMWIPITILTTVIMGPAFVLTYLGYKAGDY